MSAAKPRRAGGRRADQLRPIELYRGVLRQPAGSAYIRMGGTEVLVAASVEPSVPGWLKGSGKGWVTAEYGMLPGSVPERAPRNKPSGRSQEIQRLIGRSLRASIDLSRLGERLITLDCDVIEADGGTRTAAITAAYVALVDAVRALRKRGDLAEDPIKSPVAAVSVGMVNGTPMLDLCYEEDSAAEVDMNVVGLGDGAFVELQATGEHGTFGREDLARFLGLAEAGLKELFRLQRDCLKGAASRRVPIPAKPKAKGRA